MKKLSLAIVWIVLSFSSSALAANLFPLADGNLWTYREATSGDTFTIRVGIPSIINDTVYYSLRGYTANRLFVRMDEQLNRLMAWDDERQIEVPLILFRPEGLWWEAPFRPCDQEGQALTSPGSHEGPVGSFESTLELRYRSFGCADGIEAEQFALNYGLLRRVVTSASGPRQFDLISASIGGMTIGESALFILPASGSITRTTSGEHQLKVGYARVQPTGDLSPAAGLAMFGFRQGGILVSEAGVPAVSTIRTGRVFTENTGRVRTGLAIANPNPEPVTIAFYFTDSDGQNFGTASATLGAQQQFAGFLDEPGLFAISSPIPLSRAKTFTFSTSLPVAAIALRGLVNERNEFLMTALPVADLSRESAETVVIPHFAEGGGWITQIALLNPGDLAISGTLRFFTPSGATLETRSYSIAPRSSTTILRDSSRADIASGSIHIVPDVGHAAPVGLNIFSFRSGGITVTETGVLAIAPGAEMSLYAESSLNLRSGFAFANPGSASVKINYELLHQYGLTTGITGSLSIPANGQRSLFLDELSGVQPIPENFKGVLRITASDGAVAVIGLRGRTNERGDFLVSTTSSFSDSAQNPSQLYVPHWADGAGYTTEFILLGRIIESVNTTMYFFSPSGKPSSLTTFR